MVSKSVRIRTPNVLQTSGSLTFSSFMRKTMLNSKRCMTCWQRSWRMWAWRWMLKKARCSRLIHCRVCKARLVGGSWGLYRGCTPWRATQVLGMHVVRWSQTVGEPCFNTGCAVHGANLPSFDTLIDKHVDLRLRLRLFDTVVTPTAMYSRSVAPLTVVEKKCLAVTQGKMLRRIVGYKKAPDDTCADVPWAPHKTPECCPMQQSEIGTKS